MRLKRAYSTIATGLIVAGTVTIAGSPAHAVSDAEAYADQAIAAATAADAAFIAAEWDEVESRLDAFDLAEAALRALLDEKQALANERAALVDAANDELVDAQTAVAELMLLRNSLAAARADLVAADATVATRQVAYDAAQATLAATPQQIETCLPMPTGLSCYMSPNPAWTSASTAALAAYTQLVNATLSRDFAASWLASQERQWEAADGDARMAALPVAEAAAQAAQEALDAANAALAEVLAQIDRIADAIDSAGDRRADLGDLETVKRTVVWTLGADNETPRAGDTVKLTFTIPNSELFAISDASVRVTSPAGITPECDIVGGVVAAGAVVTCTADYVPTDADAEVGEVVFSVELTGYLPLGPGNPRSHAATQTLVAVSQSIILPVAPRAVAVVDDEPTDGESELAETGLETTGLGALAATLIAAGGTLLLMRRRAM